jgi:hypothetical protein
MLTNAERRQLADIESRLRAADPAFVRQFKTESTHEAQSRRILAAILATVTLALVLFMTHGIMGVFVMAVSSLLVAKYFAHRYVYSKLPGHYHRHGGPMD